MEPHTAYAGRPETPNRHPLMLLSPLGWWVGLTFCKLFRGARRTLDSSRLPHTMLNSNSTTTLDYPGSREHNHAREYVYGKPLHFTITETRWEESRKGQKATKNQPPSVGNPLGKRRVPQSPSKILLVRVWLLAALNRATSDLSL